MNNWNLEPFTQIDVLRHGACQGGEIFRGSTNVELAEEGWQQMDRSIEGLHWDHIVTSPLLRCRLFAEKLSQQRDIPVVVDERWREFSFGVWEGRLREQVWEENGDDVVRFFTDPATFTPEGGDTYKSVAKRVTEAWDDLLENYQGKKVLLIAHGGIIRTLYAELKSLPSDAFNSIEVPYACLSRWKNYADSRRNRSILSFHNRQMD